jgi:hypothetical protein
VSTEWVELSAIELFQYIKRYQYAKVICARGGCACTVSTRNKFSKRVSILGGSQWSQYTRNCILCTCWGYRETKIFHPLVSFYLWCHFCQIPRCCEIFLFTFFSRCRHGVSEKVNVVMEGARFHYAQGAKPWHSRRLTLAMHAIKKTLNSAAQE